MESAGDPTGENVGPYLPLFNPSHLEALRDSARRLSPRHWALVVILTKTGMEIEALGKLTWRDVYPDKVYWKPSKSPQAVSIPLEDEELAHALRIFVTGQRKGSGMLDYWIQQVREGTGLPELGRVTGYTLRLTCCMSLLQAGKDPEAVARDLRLPWPAVHRVLEEMEARGMLGRRTHEPESEE